MEFYSAGLNLLAGRFLKAKSLSASLAQNKTVPPVLHRFEFKLEHTYIQRTQGLSESGSHKNPAGAEITTVVERNYGCWSIVFILLSSKTFRLLPIALAKGTILVTGVWRKSMRAMSIRSLLLQNSRLKPESDFFVRMGLKNL